MHDTLSHTNAWRLQATNARDLKLLIHEVLLMHEVLLVMHETLSYYLRMRPSTTNVSIVLDSTGVQQGRRPLQTPR